MPADLMGGRVVSLPTMTLSKEITAFFLQCKTKTKCLFMCTSRHFAAQQNLVAIGVIADIERTTPIERALSSTIKGPFQA